MKPITLAVIATLSCLFLAGCQTATKPQNLYVVTFNTGAINKVAPDGTQSTVATGLDWPHGAAFDNAGDMFVANSADNAGGGSIVKITPDGTQTTFATDVDPQQLVFNKAGDLFEADYRSGNIYKFTPDGERSTFASGFSLPISLAFDRHGNLFVGAGYGNGNGYINKITPDGKQKLFASGLSFPAGLALDRHGNLLEADNGDNIIYKFTPDGEKSKVAVLNDPGGLTFNNTGDLYVPFSGGDDVVNVTKITPDGTQSSVATMPGTPAGLAFYPH